MGGKLKVSRVAGCGLWALGSGLVAVEGDGKPTVGGQR